MSEIGKVFFLGDNVDTDQILPGYAMSLPPERLGEAALGGSAIPDFAKRAAPGDILIAGDNFGCGSSREQAPVALKACGVRAVVAKSFARIFRRNAINIGLPVITGDCLDQVMKDTNAGDDFTIDIKAATLTNVSRGTVYSLAPLARSSLQTLQAGGLINRVREKLLARGEALQHADQA